MSELTLETMVQDFERMKKEGSRQRDYVQSILNGNVFGVGEDDTTTRSITPNTNKDNTTTPAESKKPSLPPPPILTDEHVSSIKPSPPPTKPSTKPSPPPNPPSTKPSPPPNPPSTKPSPPPNPPSTKPSPPPNPPSTKPSPSQPLSPKPSPSPPPPHLPSTTESKSSLPNPQSPSANETQSGKPPPAQLPEPSPHLPSPPPITDTSQSFGSSSSSSSHHTLPLSIQLESETLQKFNQRIPFRSYLETGYKKYKTWLAMTLGSTFSQHLNFCIARHLNQTKRNVMGLDLEIRYLIKRLENLFGKSEMKHYEPVIANTLKQNLDLSDMHIQTIIDAYHRNPQSFELTLSDEDFQSRLKQVPTQELDLHSYSCWRNSNHAQLNQTPYPVTAEDILNGEAMSPPSGAHLGLQMLEMSGYLPAMVQPRRARKYGVTFI